MSNGEISELTEGRSDHEISTPKPEFLKCLNVEIKLADGHYLARFSYGSPRVFHNMPQLLTAIEIESAKLGPGPTQT